MMKYFLLLFCITVSLQTFAQNISIHQEQLNFYNNLGLPETYYDSINTLEFSDRNFRNTCPLNKLVFGWHPYWSNGKEDLYDWNLLTDLSFFSYEVDPNTGNPLTTHGWATNDAVDSALANGIRVNLCVTLFSSHATFFGNATAVQNLITNLINAVQSRGAHGVNIDFEGIPSSQAVNFTNFMIALSNQMHAAIPNSQVSTVLYSVDWNNVFDIPALDPYVDLFTIMGYGYYFNGSSKAGPTDPLYNFDPTYNRTLSRTVTYYLNQGVTPSKLLLGLPYYGYEWSTSSAAIPSNTTAAGSAKSFQQIKNNISGFYIPANETWVYNTFSTNYTYTNGSIFQCFINDYFDMSERLEFINHAGIGGMAIWALGYDHTYTEYWDAIYDNFTDCGIKPCTDTLYDMGGPLRNYYNNEDYTYTVTADNAAQLILNFDTIDIEATFDFLYVYDGIDTNAPQIPGSPFSGQYNPFSFTSTTPYVTFRFTSDGATTNQGWKMTYTCITDQTPPVSTVFPDNSWKTQDFTASFTDTDQGTGVLEKFYLVSDYDGTDQRSNGLNGFLYDDFIQMHTDWTNQTGIWQVNTGEMQQTDILEGNSNIWATLGQDSSKAYLYEWDAVMDGASVNRRSGIHFFCDDPTLPNRGNSYFVYFRVDSDKCQIYKVVNDVWTLMTDDAVVLNPGQWYNYKIYFDPASGSIKAFADNILVSQWTDPSPHTSGNSVSLRTGNTETNYDNLRVYHSRTTTQTITIGSTSADVRYQNLSPVQPSCEVLSICIDSVNLWSAFDNHWYNIDWSEAGPLSVIDGFSNDVDTFYTPTQITGLWQAFQDTHSTTMQYYYAVGDVPGDSNIVNWTNNGLNTIFTETGLSLIYNQMYYISVRSENGAGIISNTYTTDGALLLYPSNLNEINKEKIVLYPNPVKDFVTILGLQNKPNTIWLYDARGKEIELFLNNQNQLDLREISPGVYHLKIIGEDSFQMISLIKM